MKQSTIHIKTLKESPFEGKMESQQLMFRAGMMKKNGAGDYTLMPYGLALYNVLKEKVDTVFEQMAYQAIHTLDYNQRDILAQLRSDIVSYKDLPLYIQMDSLVHRQKHSVKHGLLKSRTLPVKGLQLLLASEEDFDQALKNLWDQLFELHKTLEIPFNVSQLFEESQEGIRRGTWLSSPHGDTQFFNCHSCAYCSDQVGAQWKIEAEQEGQVQSMQEILTPNIKTISDLEKFLSISSQNLMKTLLLQCEIKGKPLTVAVVVRGDRELNMAKVAKYLGLTSHALEMVTDPGVIDAAGTIVGFAGPVGLTEVMLLADKEVTGGQGMVTGANRKDYHLQNVVYGRDFETKHVGDFSTINQGDLCPVCGQPLISEMGYTVMTITDYRNVLSKGMDIKYKNDQMKEGYPFVALGQLDYYRLMVAYLDAHYDAGGFKLKKGLSPYDVHVVIPNIKKEDQCLVADQLVFELESKGMRVLLDDRKGSAGAKFKDSDLLGIPVRITAGKLADKGIVELKYRSEEERKELTIKEVLDKL